MAQLSKREIQDIQLEILDCVHAFCEKNGITYFLTGGSLIGALRHNGFIPWDDDIDIMMYRDEYEAFIESFNKEYSRYHAFSLRDTGYNYHFCKICAMNTVLEETDLTVSDIPLGINIDLFPLDKLPEGTDQEKLMGKLHRLDKKMHGKAFNMKRIGKRPFRQRLLILAYRAWACFTSRRALAYKQQQIAMKYADSNTNQYSLITCQIRRRFPILDRSITAQEDHVFEDRIYKIPSTYDRYLREQFGDYMTPPPEAGRTSGHAFTASKKGE